MGRGDRKAAIPRTKLAGLDILHTLSDSPVKRQTQGDVMRHVISALVMNEPGVLANVAGMFAARGFNIDSLVVGRTEDPNLSRMTIVCSADDNTLDQVRKQLAKLVPVVSVRDFKGASYVERDLMLLTVAVEPEQRSEVSEVVRLFHGKVSDVSSQSMMIEMAGDEEKL